MIITITLCLLISGIVLYWHYTHHAPCEVTWNRWLIIVGVILLLVGSPSMYSSLNTPPKQVHGELLEKDKHCREDAYYCSYSGIFAIPGYTTIVDLSRIQHFQMQVGKTYDISEEYASDGKITWGETAYMWGFTLIFTGCLITLIWGYGLRREITRKKKNEN